VNGRSVMQYDFARRTLTGEIFHADDVISLFDVIGDNELLVNIGGVEPDNRVLSSWQDAAAGKIDQSAR
jgi:hypothetical protein